MNPAPSGDEERHIVPDDTPPPPPGQPPSRGDGVTFVASVLLIAIAFSVGLSHLLEKRWGRTRAATRQATAQSVDNNGPSGASGAQLSPEMLHVSSVSLGSSRLAIVNGKPVTEGESIVVSTPAGPVAVQVAKIETGMVHFISGDEKIDVNVDSSFAERSSP